MLINYSSFHVFGNIGYLPSRGSNLYVAFSTTIECYVKTIFEAEKSHRPKLLVQLLQKLFINSQINSAFVIVALLFVKLDLKRPLIQRA